MTVRSGEAAWDWARQQVGKQAYSMMCKAFVRTAFNIVPSQSLTALECWQEADHRHPVTDLNDIPAYVAVFQDTNVRAEHVFITGPRNANGKRLCISTDAGPNNSIGLTTVERIRSWGPMFGWTEDMDGQRFWTPPANKPVVGPTVEERVIEMVTEIRSQWVNHRIADRGLMSLVQKTGSPAWAAKMDECGDGIDPLMKELLT